MTVSLMVIQSAGILLTSILFVSGIRYLMIKPRTWRSSPGNVLILAAHPDDCVVMAGEYAIWALDHGFKVDIVYLTCGAIDPASTRAKTREREAVSSWQSLGVPKSSLTFIGYSASPLRGNSALGIEAQDQARATIQNIILTLEVGAAVFLPAAGEEHVDHRMMRRLGLEAIVSSRRHDVLVLEAPEYNATLSLVRSPTKAYRYLLGCMPIVRRLTSTGGTPCFPGYIRGERAFVLGDPRITQRKNALLSFFASENIEKLVRHFGYQNQFRKVVFPISQSDERFGLTFVKIGRFRLGLAIAGLWVAMYMLSFGVSWYLVEQAIVSALGSNLALGFLMTLALLLLFASIRIRAHREPALVYVSSTLGILGGLVADYF
jgi:LmbE family N-acetylglucosaminyl deacetylase